MIQEKLDHQLALHKDHIKLQNNISDLSDQIVAASEVFINQQNFLTLECDLCCAGASGKRRGAPLRRKSQCADGRAGINKAPLVKFCTDLRGWFCWFQCCEFRRILESRKKECSEAEAKCEQLDAWLNAERQTIQDLLALKSNFESRISQVW